MLRTTVLVADDHPLCSGERICEAVAAVARGEVVLPDEGQAGLAAQVQARNRPAVPLLTAREGGARLRLSPATIKSHIGTLCEKLGVSDRAAAVAEAMRGGMLE